MTLTQVFLAICSPQATFRKTFNKKDTFKNLDGQEYYTWRAVRRQHINNLTNDVWWIIFDLTIAAATGPDQHHLRPDKVAESQAVIDQLGYYGVVYECGKVLWWAFGLVASLVIALLWYPLLMWLDDGSPNRNVTKVVTDKNGVPHEITQESATGIWHYLELMNKYCYTAFTYIRVGMFIYHLYETIKHINAKPVSPSNEAPYPTDHRRVWYTRGCLIAGILAGMGLGLPVMIFWHRIELVHVTHQEYAIIIVPIQIIIGIVVASIFQAWFEKERQLPTESGLNKRQEIKIDEKTPQDNDDGQNRGVTGGEN